MKRISLLGAFVLVLGSMSVAASPVHAQDRDSMVVWLDDYDEALREAKRTGKPIFLEFRCAP